MSKKSTGGLFALLTGMAAGAAAVFLSKKENREKAKAVLHKAEKEIETVSAEVKKNPKKFAKKVEKQGEKLAKKVVKSVSQKSKPARKKVTVAAKKTVKKAKSSPVLKVVGKKK